MNIPRRDIEDNLQRKGFVKDNSKHRYFYHEYDGKRTGAYAYVSHGSKYKVYGDTLIKLLKRELKLNTNKQTIDLLKCPMSEGKYVEILKTNGII